MFSVFLLSLQQLSTSLTPDRYPSYRRYSFRCRATLDAMTTHQKNIYKLIILSVNSIRLQCFSRRDHASSRLTGILRGIRDTAGHVVDRSLAVVDFGAVLPDRYNTNMGIKVLCGRMRTSYFRWDARKTTRQEYKLPGHRDVLRVSRTSTTVGVQYVGRHTDARRTRFS